MMRARRTRRIRQRSRWSIEGVLAGLSPVFVGAGREIEQHYLRDKTSKLERGGSLGTSPLLHFSPGVLFLKFFTR